MSPICILCKFHGLEPEVWVGAREAYKVVRKSPAASAVYLFGAVQLKCTSRAYTCFLWLPEFVCPIDLRRLGSKGQLEKSKLCMLGTIAVQMMFIVCLGLAKGFFSRSRSKEFH